MLVALAVSGACQAANAPVCLSSDESDCEEYSTTTSCTLYLAESSVHQGRLTLFAGRDFPSQHRLAADDLLVSIVDSNKNEYSPWHDITWGAADLWKEAFLQNNYTHDLFMAGIASLATCGGETHTNVMLDLDQVVQDNLGVHRSIDPTAGSFSYLQNASSIAIQNVQAGDELFVECHDAFSDELSPKNNVETRRSIEWLERHGTCVDVLAVGPSNLSKVGRGAFLKRPVQEGNVIISSPMLHFDKSQLEILQQEFKEVHAIPMKRWHGIEYTDKLLGYQLLRNYVYGHPDSNVMLLPLAPGVNFINHNGKEANAVIRWSLTLGENDYLKSLSVMELFESAPGENGYLVMEFVALRDLVAGEEIFIDYGKEWDEAWTNNNHHHHSRQWKGVDKDYVSAANYREKLANEPIRTHDEQSMNPYPENIRTACFFRYEQEDEGVEKELTWSGPIDECLRPCDIIDRSKGSSSSSSSSSSYTYKAVIHSSENVFEPSFCGEILEGGILVSNIPSDAVTFVDRPYTTDSYLSVAFRHEIVVPDGFYPRHWLVKDSKPFGDFIASPLEPGMMAPIRWADSAEVVTPWAFRVGVPASVREVLLEYCNRLGITDIFRHVTSHGNGLEPEANGFLDLDGKSWYLQRPSADWRSNLHWLSPGDHPAHEDYLQALGAAGFDKVLEGVGRYLEMDGLVAFHVTFIAVSHSTQGYLHHDVLDTGRKTYNVIVPLILANETGPELDLMEGCSYDDDHDQSAARVGRYRYEYNVGSMMGDGAIHATSACDYRNSKEMRMAATVYIADVNERNADSILNEYTQAFPPDELDLLLSWAGRHWRKDDPTVKLPKPGKDHILLRTESVAES